MASAKHHTNELDGQTYAQTRDTSVNRFDTIPNRLYSMCGHTFGLTDNPSLARLPWAILNGLEIKDSIFQLIEAKPSLDWRIYSGTPYPWAALIKGIREALVGTRNPKREGGPRRANAMVSSTRPKRKRWWPASKAGVHEEEAASSRVLLPTTRTACSRSI